MSTNFDVGDALKMQSAFLDRLRECLGRVVSMDGQRVTITETPTEYVIGGRIYHVKSSFGTWPTWVGLNGPRIFYIAYATAKANEAKDAFAFCFGGAEKVGWEFNYEPSADMNGDFVSLWGTCMTDGDKPLAFMDKDVPISAAPLGSGPIHGIKTRPPSVTAYGDFWVTDIAMMVQSYIRTCERLNFRAPTNRLPAPL
jgi:hypothetical protein